MSATDDDREVAARRRRVARRHHPDLGGDPAAFVAAMDELDRPAPQAHRVEIVLSARSRRRRRWGAARRLVTDGAGRLRHLRLPRRRRPDEADPTDPQPPNDPNEAERPERPAR